MPISKLRLARLLHDVLAGEVILALAQHLLEPLGDAVANTVAASSWSPSGYHLVMKARTFVHRGIVFPLRILGILQIAALRMPCPFSYRPALPITLPTDTETLVRKWIGFHFSSPRFLIDWAANFGRRDC